MNNLRLLTILFLLIACGKCTLEEEPHHHQDPLETFSAQCCQKGYYLHHENNTCVNKDGVQSNAESNLPTCSEGMFILNPNANQDDIFMEVNGNLELIIMYEADAEDSSVSNGSWCAANLLPEEGNLTVALVCFEGDYEYGTGTVHTLYGLCLIISCIFLVATLVVYVLLPELRDVQGLCLMANIFSLILGYFTLALIQFAGHTISDEGCIFSAFFMYYWLLSAFFWLSIVSFNVWRNIVNRTRGCPQSGPAQFFIYTAYGWGCPAVFLIAILAVHYAPEDYESLYRPRFGEASCWFHGPEETWIFFYGPISIIIAANIYFFITSAIRMWRINKETESGSMKSKKLKCAMYMKLFIVMGITWVFEVASFVEGSKSWFWYITDVLNCLQGIFFFCILICRQRVLFLISSRSWGYKILGNKFQQQAEELHSEEEDEAGEEIELANPS